VHVYCAVVSVVILFLRIHLNKNPPNVLVVFLGGLIKKPGWKPAQPFVHDKSIIFLRGSVEDTLRTFWFADIILYSLVYSIR